MFLVHKHKKSWHAEFKHSFTPFVFGIFFGLHRLMSGIYESVYLGRSDFTQFLRTADYRGTVWEQPNRRLKGIQMHLSGRALPETYMIHTKLNKRVILLQCYFDTTKNLNLILRVVLHAGTFL